MQIQGALVWQTGRAWWFFPSRLMLRPKSRMLAVELVPLRVQG